MVSLASCFRFLPLHLLQCLRHQLVPRTLRLRVISLKDASLAGARRFPGLFEEFLLFLGWNHRGLFQTCLLQCLLLLGRDSFFCIFVVEPLARFLRRPFVTSWRASVWIFFWTLPMTCFRMYSTSPCCDGASVASLFLHWQVHLVVISVGQSFAPEALSPCELQSFLLGFLVFQIGTNSASNPAAVLSFIAWCRFCLQFSVLEDMFVWSSLLQPFRGKILLFKIFWQRQQQCAAWFQPVASALAFTRSGFSHHRFRICLSSLVNAIMLLGNTRIWLASAMGRFSYSAICRVSGWVM